MDDPSTIFNDKLAKVLSLHTRLEYKDTKKETLGKKRVLQTYHRAQYKELDLIIFEFPLNDI